MLERSVASLCIPCILCGKRKGAHRKHRNHRKNTEGEADPGRNIGGRVEGEWTETGQRLDNATTTTEEIR